MAGMSRRAAAGEIIVKGPTVFAGYWNNPTATAAALRNGWFHTGDLGRRDEEGFLYIVGRKTDVIICSGENIYAAEVEHAIEALPQVAEAAVVGMADNSRGEVAVAVVVLKETDMSEQRGLARRTQRTAGTLQDSQAGDLHQGPAQDRQRQG